ncbi:sensor histidine kinase [Halogeometricum limi]|uniref:histidine kinase n=1 Tax=Halogeometricum limi TaxID=555875 RepID=A0A1I6HJ54_9EURY|nr:PAS domain-containing sensor histidine kinase [Halogeometricum limi]SFR54327.1 PAS fold-containing protein [Halogeometricum limi]
MTTDRERAASPDDGVDSTSADGDDAGSPVVLVVGDGGDVAAALRTAGLAVRRAPTEDRATKAFDCLVVVADAVAALDDVESVHSAVPVVFVGGGETAAEAAFEAGADEFVAAADATAPAVVGARVRGVLARAENSLLEADLARERSLLDAIFETVPAHLYVKDREAKHVRVSEAYVDDADRFLGKTDYEVFRHERSRDTYRDDVRIMERDEPIFDQEEPVVTSDTHKFSLRHLLEEHGEFETLTGNWVLTSKVPWHDEDGEVVGLVGFTVDISEEKAYRERLERQNERLDEFAGIVSHDLRSPLNVAQGYLELLGESVDDEAARGHLERIEQAHRRMSELIEDVLSLARQGAVVNSATPTHVGDAATRAWRTAVRGDDAVLDVETDDLTVDADAGRLSELLGNLFVNSVEHGTDDGNVTVRIGSLDDGFFVEDDGSGIPEDRRESVFETGFTTDSDGTGFGLAIVRRIAEAHGWAVRATASDSGGARFEFDLCTPSDGPFEDPERARTAEDEDAEHREGAGG